MRRVQGLVISCLLDTDVCIDFLRRREYARPLLRDWLSRGLLAVSAITHLEIYTGMRRGEEQVTAAFLDFLVAVPVDETIARSAGQMINRLRAKGITMSPLDSIIAATALYVNAPLVTNNISDYPAAEIRSLAVVRGTGK